MVANNNSLQSPPANDQVHQLMSFGIEIPFDTDKTEPEQSRSPVTGDRGSDNCVGLFYRDDVDVLETTAKNTIFMSGSLGFSAERSL